MDSNIFKVNSLCRNEQHHGGPWKPNKELTWTNHFGFSLRDKAPMSGFGNIRVKAVTTWSEKQIVIFHVEGHLLFNILSFVWVAFRLDYLSYAFSQISVRRALTCELLLKFMPHHVGNRQLQRDVPFSTGCSAGQCVLCSASTDTVFLGGTLQCWENKGTTLYVCGLLFAKNNFRYLWL